MLPLSGSRLRLHVAGVLLVLAAVACGFGPAALVAAGDIPLTGYFCAQCDANPIPVKLVSSIHPAYTTVIFAFAGWDTSGNVTNQWDCNDPRMCPKNFTLTRAIVANLQGEGRKVLMSVGGAAGAVLTSNEPPSFVANMVQGLVAVTRQFGLDGIDLDIENRDGDATGCSVVVTNIMRGYRSALPSALITLAPQMVDIYPDISDVSLGFNAQAPLVSMAIQEFAAIQVQMYNSWAQVETVAYAQQYVAKLTTGYTVQGDGESFPVRIPGSKLILGYPASPSGASSGYIDPSAVVGLVQTLKAQGTPIAGLMTWSIGWDHLNNWLFASTVAAA